jgi:LysM repeat protein
MTLKRLIAYLILNAIVSATVTLTVLWLWDRTHATTPLSLAATPVSNAPATTALVTATRPPAPTATPATYTVQFGDTLGLIAQRFGLQVEDLLAANGLTNPDSLSVGQVLIIPVIGSPSAAPTVGAAATVESPLATATPNPNAPPPRLAIREVRAAGNLSDETIVIVNLGGPVDLAGWTVRDETGRQYTFPTLRLFENGAVNLHTASGTDTVTDLHWNQTEAVWASGRLVQLNDLNGNLHARFTVP